MLKSILAALFLLFCINKSLATYVEYDGWLNIELYHAIDPNEPEKFTPRGNISITSLNSGSASISQEPLSTNDQHLLKNLAFLNKWYRLKAIVTNQDGRKTDFLTSARACALVRGQLTDVLWISLDHVGAVIGVSQTITGANICPDVMYDKYLDGIREFNTDIFVRHMELAPIPDTASFIQKIEREREARERGDVKDNRGFFAKYWMYIVPVAILVLISGATNPDATGGAGAGGR